MGMWSGCMKCNGITSPQASGNDDNVPNGGACADKPDTLLSPFYLRDFIKSCEISGASFTEML